MSPLTTLVASMEMVLAHSNAAEGTTPLARGPKLRALQEAIQQAAPVIQGALKALKGAGA